MVCARQVARSQQEKISIMCPGSCKDVHASGSKGEAEEKETHMSDFDSFQIEWTGISD